MPQPPLIANILNPNSNIIGGGVSAVGDILLKRIQKYFLQYAFLPVRTSSKVKLAELGNDAGVIGAA
jgi:glucokinase